MLKQDQLQTFKHCSAYHKNNINGLGGVCILVKNNFIHSQVQFQADLQAVAVCITINNKAYTVASVYASPSETLNELAFDRMIKSISSRYLILGDFNGHSYSWGANHENERDKSVEHLTLKRPGLCSWLRSTQFKPRLDWVGSAAQVRRYCVDSAAQAFIHALVVASRAVYSTRFAALAVRGPRILRPTRLMFSQPMSLLVSHNLALSGRVKNVYRHLLHFLTLMFSNKVETDQYIFHLLFLRHKCADYLCHSLHRYACRYTGTLSFI